MLKVFRFHNKPPILRRLYHIKIVATEPIILPFTYAGSIFKAMGVLAIGLFLSGLFGYCPLISLVKSKDISREDNQ